MSQRQVIRLVAVLWPIFVNDLSAELPSVPLQENRPSRDGKVGFTRLSADVSGVGMKNMVMNDHPLSFLHHSGMICGGAAIGDFDGDGKPDIYLVNGPMKNRVYRQTDRLVFEEMTDQWGGDGGDLWGAAATVVDIDGDGDLDIHVCNYDAPNQLYLNERSEDGGIRFVDRAEEWGLAVKDASFTTSFADYDLDGDLDVFLAMNRLEDPAGYPEKAPVDLTGEKVALLPGLEKYYRVWRYDYDNWGTEPMGRPDRLFRNEGGRFVDFSTKAGLHGRGDALSATWWDYNLDGYPDLYVANDFISEDLFWHNNGDGTFTEMADRLVPHTPWLSMGADAGDLNNDLLPDLMVADMAATNHFKQKTTMGGMGGMSLIRANASNPPQYSRNAVYLNNGSGRMQEAAFLLGLDSTDWTWTVKFADLDCDGWKDIYITNGTARHMNDSDLVHPESALHGRHIWDLYAEGEMRMERNIAYRNEERGTKFRDADEWGLAAMNVSYASAHGDLDLDGDIDLVEVILEGTVEVIENHLGGRAVEFRLEGPKGGNTWGLGARVTITTASGQQVQTLNPHTGYLTSNEPVVHFGLGKDTVVQKVLLEWPGGGRSEYQNLAAGRRYTLPMPAPGSGSGEMTSPGRMTEAPYFTKSDVLVPAKHKESETDDFKAQPLLPHRLSQMGPPMAFGDADGDGKEDLFLGGSAGSAGEIRLNKGEGVYRAIWVDAFSDDAAHEDMGALFLDVDGDGDQDLFVASGSYEFKEGSPELADRLYLNDGSGGFERAPAGAVAKGSFAAGSVSAADFDRDGDLDVFVGGRLRPGRYPQSGTSRLLRNDSTSGAVKFIDVTAELASGLVDSGMVTGSQWADMDGDGWQDLLLSHEWGPIRLFRNQKGRLSAGAGSDLAGLNGWWNGLLVEDLDGDGDLDVVASNLGTNTKYGQPSLEKPHLTYFGDFEENGEAHIVEVQREGDVLYPERGRSCSSAAMDFIAKDFGTFKDFAAASLVDVYSEEKLKKAERYSAHEFRTGIFWNEGGKFRFDALPQIVQVAPSYGIGVFDLDADGLLDLAFAQNFFGPQDETGRFDGGIGQVLRGDGRGGFDALPAGRTGLAQEGDGMALAVVDFDGEDGLDLVISRNGQSPELFLGGELPVGRKMVAVQLDAPDAKLAGARVHFSLGENSTSRLLSFGSGYLSQGPRAQYFHVDAKAVGSVKVTWGDGTVSSAVPVSVDQDTVRISAK